MKLLIITQKVDKNDPILGFFHNWISKFSEKFEKISVICLEKGSFDLPSNVKVYSLGKESGRAKIKYVKNFFNLILGLHRDYEAVFVHMNPEYIVLSGFLWKVFGKKIFLWYSHRSIDLKLRLATFLSDGIFTPAPQGFGIKSKKVFYTGHGINFDDFKIAYNHKKDDIVLLHVGRITRIKNIDILIKAVAKLKSVFSKRLKLILVGGTITSDDKKYSDSLKRIIIETNTQDVVEFRGFVPPSQIQNLYGMSDLSINLAPTGGLDKVVLESIACGVPVLVSNSTFIDLFGKYSGDLVFLEKNQDDLAEKIKALIDNNEKQKIADYLLVRSKERHDLGNTIDKISLIIKNK